MFTKCLLGKEIGELEIVGRNVLKIWHCQLTWLTWYLFVCFETMILITVQSMWFGKYVFSANIWFVNTTNRIVKCESRVVKCNPICFYF